MKKIFILSPLCLFLFSCSKQDQFITNNNEQKDLTAIAFTNYTIRQGEHFCNDNRFASVEYAELKFVVKFDSTAIYTTVNPSNQDDINKLYGFSDNNAAHQQYSARFGWRWSDKALRIFAYTYNNGIRASKELGRIPIGIENTYSIKVMDAHYIFSLNNSIDTMHRLSRTHKGAGYKLYPYFGGDETAPHEIHIQIKEIGD